MCREEDITTKSARLGDTIGTSISKQELSSLIRYSANAIIDQSNNGSDNSISDIELDLLLERNGRDKSSEPVLNQLDHTSLDAALAITPLGEQQLEEVDLRQLGNLLYTKKKSGDTITDLDGEIKSKKTPFDEFEFMGKRKRIERITMFDGKGTGYGGSVPVLNDNVNRTVEIRETVCLRKSRSWEHQGFCCLCGKSVNSNSANQLKSNGNKRLSSIESESETANILKCAHCPRSFHVSCIDDCESSASSILGHDFESIWKGSGMFICPHHKCVGCNRSTASAGGLLFRCLDCLTSYCEDCLPQDEIDSVGRSKEMELLGYESKQSYFIKCPYCVSFATSTDDSQFSSSSQAVFSTQLMRVHKEQIIEVVVNSGRTKEKKTGRGRKKIIKKYSWNNEIEENADNSHVVTSNSSEICTIHTSRTAPRTLSECIDLLLTKAKNLRCEVVFGFVDTVVDLDDDNIQLFTGKQRVSLTQQWLSIPEKVSIGKCFC